MKTSDWISGAALAVSLITALIQWGRSEGVNEAWKTTIDKNLTGLSGRVDAIEEQQRACADALPVCGETGHGGLVSPPSGENVSDWNIQLVLGNLASGESGPVGGFFGSELSYSVEGNSWRISAIGRWEGVKPTSLKPVIYLLTRKKPLRHPQTSSK